VTTLKNIVGPRKISAGENHNLYLVSSEAVVLDVDLRPKVTCDEMRKIFPTVMQNTPRDHWKHHFGFDKWLPDIRDASPSMCEATDECKGMTDNFNPICRCPEGMKTSEALCDNPIGYAECAASSCKRMGCLHVGVKGRDKQAWAHGWFAGVNNPQKIVYSQGWEHYPRQALSKTIKLCLHQHLDKKPEDVAIEKDMRVSPETILKGNLNATAEVGSVEDVNRDCGAKYGSWWKVRLMKEVQMIRHMCGPRGTPKDHCPVAYLMKMVTCSQQMIGHRTGLIPLPSGGDLRKPLKEVCCVDKAMTSFLSPRLEDLPSELPGDLKAQALLKLNQFVSG
jgi:hypothetical protein